MIKNLLIAYNGGAASDAALHLALQMAKKYQAHLTGISAHGVSSLTRNIPSWLSAEMRDTITEVAARRSEEVAARFAEFARGRIAEEKLHWIVVRASPDDAVSSYARLFEVTILGQYENLIAADERVLHPDRIANERHRPILVVPKGFDAPDINERAVVAWDGKPSAARALFDAMQVLETKEFVEIISVGEIVPAPKNVDLVELLARHGVRAEHNVIPKSGSIAKTLLSHCKNSDTGLLVLGAYQYSKLSEDLFGGVTSSVLKEAEIPLFLSHCPFWIPGRSPAPIPA